MNVTVEYWAQVKQAAGTSAERIDVNPPCSARDVVTELAHRHGGRLRGVLLDADGKLRSTILLFVRDEQVRPDEPAELRDGDVIGVMSPIAGG